MMLLLRSQFPHRNKPLTPSSLRIDFRMDIVVKRQTAGCGGRKEWGAGDMPNKGGCWDEIAVVRIL